MKILAGPNSSCIAKKISDSLKIDLIKFTFKQFYDGESYLRIDDNVKNEDILIVQTTYPKQEKSILEIMLLASTLKNMGADRILVCIPYLCYARADKRKLEGEVLSHQLILSYLQNAGVDSLITINVHNTDAFILENDSLEKENLNVLPFMVNEFLKDKNIQEWIIVGPDQGSQKDIRLIAEEFSVEYYIMEKQRDAKTHEIHIKEPNFNFIGKNILILDDIISSGTTAQSACSIILKNGAKSVSLLFVHVLSQPDIFARFYQLGQVDIFSSNTIIRDDIKQIDISSLLSKFIEEKYL